jgi:cytochrome c-type biogenesis protein CcmH
MKTCLSRLLAVVTALMMSALVMAVPGTAQVVISAPEISLTPEQTSHARDINKVLRCVVCQNQSIDESNAPLAVDLRNLVRERLAAGETDKQAVQFIVQRYGNFVLLRPPFQFNTLLLWLGPFLLFALAGLMFVGRMQSAAITSAPDTSRPAELSADDEQRLAQLLQEPAGQKN